ncbi:hypothetical protein LXA43DRAFT_1069614, partial [Ganoderma leucocontextum]
MPERRMTEIKTVQRWSPRPSYIRLDYRIVDHVDARYVARPPSLSPRHHGYLAFLNLETGAVYLVRLDHPIPVSATLQRARVKAGRVLASRPSSSIERRSGNTRVQEVGIRKRTRLTRERLGGSTGVGTSTCVPQLSHEGPPPNPEPNPQSQIYLPPVIQQPMPKRPSRRSDMTGDSSALVEQGLMGMESQLEEPANQEPTTGTPGQVEEVEQLMQAVGIALDRSRNTRLIAAELLPKGDDNTAAAFRVTHTQAFVNDQYKLQQREVDERAMMQAHTLAAAQQPRVASLRRHSFHDLQTPTRNIGQTITSLMKAAGKGSARLPALNEGARTAPGDEIILDLPPTRHSGEDRHSVAFLEKTTPPMEPGPIINIQQPSPELIANSMVVREAMGSHQLKINWPGDHRVSFKDLSSFQSGADRGASTSALPPVRHPPTPPIAPPRALTA